MTSKKPYFPNNWKKYKDAPDEVFKPLTYEEFNDWRVCSWEFPDSVSCVIRVQRTDTLKVSEFVYERLSAATKKLDKLIQDPLNEITIADHDEIHLIKYFDEENPLLDTDGD